MTCKISNKEVKICTSAFFSVVLSVCRKHISLQLKKFIIPYQNSVKSWLYPVACYSGHPRASRARSEAEEGSEQTCSKSPRTRALGATISGMRHKCRLRSETGWAEFGYILWIRRLLWQCYDEIQNGCSQSLSFSDRWSRGTKTLGTRLGSGKRSTDMHGARTSRGTVLTVCDQTRNRNEQEIDKLNGSLQLCRYHPCNISNFFVFVIKTEKHLLRLIDLSYQISV